MSSTDATDGGDEPVVLRMDHVRRTFRAGKRTIEAVRDVSFAARGGRVTGLIGPDAAGKTTLMRLAAGLLVPDSGDVTVLGMNAATESLAVQAALGYMPQQFGLYEDLSVRENLRLYADLQGVPVEQRADRFGELMDMTALGPFMDRLAGRLSGGMKQKLGLACTLVRSPRLLLLDEATVGVDPISRRELWGIVYRLVREEGVSVVLSTAYLDEAERCDEVVMLHEGRVLGVGPPAEFRRRAAGRAYFVRAAAAGKRRLQRLLSQADGVVDAILQGDRIRVVTAEPDRPPPVEGLPAADVQATVPRFEDGFISILRERVHADRSSAEKVSDTFSPKREKVSDTGREKVSDAGAPAVEVEDLQRRFGDFHAVAGISFQVRRGEVFGLLGANGAGKSTTFRMLCGLLPASGGRLRVAGLDLRRAAAAARARIGYMAQKFSLYGDLSVRQNLRFFSRAYGLSGRRGAGRVDWALEQFQLTEYADTDSRTLPLGYKQRLAMAAALMHEPEILFLDEPTSGVDPLARREFWRRISELAEADVTVMVTTHFMEEAEYCDRLAIMDRGRILAIGGPDELRARARAPGRPEPTMEDAFVQLIQAAQSGEASR